MPFSEVAFNAVQQVKTPGKGEANVSLGQWKGSEPLAQMRALAGPVCPGGAADVWCGRLVLLLLDQGGGGCACLAAASVSAQAVEAARSDIVTAKEEAERQRQLAQEREAKRKLRDEEADVPLTPREWRSETAGVTAAEIEAMTVKEKRPLIKQTVFRKARTLGGATSFQPFADRVLSLKAPKVGARHTPATLRLSLPAEPPLLLQ